MALKIGTYVKENFFGIVITLMLSLFIWQYQQDRTDAKEFRKDVTSQVDKMNNRQLTVAHVLFYDPDTAPEWKVEFLEWLKMETRGGNYTKTEYYGTFDYLAGRQWKLLDDTGSILHVNMLRYPANIIGLIPTALGNRRSHSLFWNNNRGGNRG